MKNQVFISTGNDNISQFKCNDLSSVLFKVITVGPEFAPTSIKF